MTARMVSVLIGAATLAMAFWAVGIMVQGLVLAMRLLRRPTTFRRIAAALLMALGVFLVGTVMVTGLLVTPGAAQLVRFRAAFAQVENQVRDGLAALRRLLAGFR